jgi:hypothetical protein
MGHIKFWSGKRTVACLMKLLIPTIVECGWYVNRNISVETNLNYADVLETNMSQYSFIHHQSDVD